MVSCFLSCTVTYEEENQHSQVKSYIIKKIPLLKLFIICYLNYYRGKNAILCDTKYRYYFSWRIKLKLKKENSFLTNDIEFILVILFFFFWLYTSVLFSLWKYIKAGGENTHRKYT